MPDIVASVTEAPSAFWAVIKKYWIFFILALLALLVIIMAKKDTIVGWFTTSGSTTKGDKMPSFLRSWLGLTSLAIICGGVLLSSPAWAGIASTTCCAEHVVANGSLDQAWHFVLAILGGGAVAFGITRFGAPDVLDLLETHGGPSLVVGALTTTTPQSLYVKSSTHSTTKTTAGKTIPLVATDLTIELDCNITQTTSGTHTLDDQDFASLITYLEVKSPTMGNLTDQRSCTGPILDFVTSFLGNAFERSGDAPVISIVVPTGSGSSTAITKYFTLPFAKRFLDKPLTTAPWLGLLHNTDVSIGLAPDTCLAGASTGASVNTRVLRGSVSYLPVPVWYYPLVAYDRVDEPASGSNGLTFKNFGSPGPKCTEKTDYVHTIGHLSSLKGLGGNLTFDTITQILAPAFGLDNVTDISHLVKSRLRAQYMGHVGSIDYSESGNHVVGTTNEPGLALDKLLFMLFKQPGLDMAVENMMQMGSLDELPLQYLTTGSRTGADKFYFGALRKVSSSVIADWQALPGSQMPSTIGATTDVRTNKTTTTTTTK